MKTATRKPRARKPHFVVTFTYRAGGLTIVDGFGTRATDEAEARRLCRAWLDRANPKANVGQAVQFGR